MHARTQNARGGRGRDGVTQLLSKEPQRLQTMCQQLGRGLNSPEEDPRTSDSSLRDWAGLGCKPCSLCGLLGLPRKPR